MADINEKVKRAKDIASMVPYWDKTDAIVDGYEAVKSERDKFLPKFAEESREDYDIRLGLTKFTNIYRDVLEGLATKPFEEEITLVTPKGKETAPPQIVDFCENVDGSGNSLTSFSAQTFFNGINSAIAWVFVDHPTVDPAAVISVADAKAANIKPFWSHVLARNVLEVRSEIIGSEEVLSYMRILEPGTNDDPDRVRIFTRPPSGNVTWQLWEKNPKAMAGSKEEYTLVREGTLTINVIPFVPFMTGRRDGKTFKFFPVMQDAADLQITLYQEESALQFIKTMAGYPMLAANGMKPEKGADGKPIKLAIGPMKVLYGLPDAAGGHGTWTFIEPTANSMEFLQKSITETKQDLRELGRQPLTALTGQLTVITTAVAAGKARSAVSAWALSLKNSIEKCLALTALWMSLKDYKPQVNVYTEFDDITETRNDLQELGAARTRNDISRETYWAELKRRKVLSPEFDGDTENTRLLNEIPSSEAGFGVPPPPPKPTPAPKGPPAGNDPGPQP